MAAPIYCTHKELKRVFPQLDSFDGKTPIYGWEEGMLNFTSSTIDCYFAHNTGSIDTLYWDGAEIDKIPFNTTETTKVNHAGFSASHSSVTVDDGSAFAENDIIKINEESKKFIPNEYKMFIDGLWVESENKKNRLLKNCKTIVIKNNSILKYNQI